MSYDLRYLGRSEVVTDATASSVRFAPNLARERVSFDGEVAEPVRFREAMSALHEVVVGDLRIKKKDKTAYRAWLEQQKTERGELRRKLFEQLKGEAIARIGGAASAEPLPATLEQDFRRMHKLYWNARVRWANELAQNDPELFRHLVPCDPVVTVAQDVVFFECFAKDESSYGCLFVDRGAFRGVSESSLGTTNVDYSLALYQHFQTLRSYRPTRLLVDPHGFEVHVQGRDELRHEKIDLPPSWLRGFGQISAATALPARRVTLQPAAVYDVLAWLKRNREKTGPRSMRFALVPGEPPMITLDPWGVKIPCRGPLYRGERPEEIKLWGRRRLFPLARLLPIAERIEVDLLGSGLPSVWTVVMGEMRFVLALSGWTANDWTSGAALDLLAGDLRADARTFDQVATCMRSRRSATLGELSRAVPAPREALLGAVYRLARQGQLVFDFAAGRYRWRSVMPAALSETLIGPEPIELVEGRKLTAEGAVRIEREEPVAKGRVYVMGKVGGTRCEVVLDDTRIASAKCPCKHFYKNRLRLGPCRHLIALRTAYQSPPEEKPKTWLH